MQRAEAALTAALEGALVQQARHMRRAAKTGAWFTVVPSTVNGTELGAQEWRDALFLRYRLELPDLPSHCDGCDTKFSISHALDCKKGGLVTARHNEIRDGVADLAGKAFTPAHVRDDPLIYSGRAMSRTKPKPSGSKLTSPQETTTEAPEVTEQKGDLLSRYRWQQWRDSVQDRRVVNTDAMLYVRISAEKCLQEAERGKKKIYLEACLQKRRQFSPFVASLDGLLGVEATATLKRISSCLATKWRQPYSKTCGYVKSRVAITLVRATHRCLRGSRVPAHRISVQQPQWEDGAGLNLFR